MAEKKGLFVENNHATKSTEDFESQPQEEYMISTPRTRPERSQESTRSQEKMNSFYGYQCNSGKDDMCMDRSLFQDKMLYSDQRSPVRLSDSQKDGGPAESMSFNKSHIQVLEYL